MDPQQPQPQPTPPTPQPEPEPTQQVEQRIEPTQQPQSQPPVTPTNPTPVEQPKLDPPPKDSIIKRAWQNKAFRDVMGLVFIVGSALIMALLLIRFVFHTYVVDGDSMNATLANNDRLIVLKAQKTWSSIRGEDYIPERGQVVVFERPGSFDFATGAEKQLIKRVIALPGERVVIQDGDVTVYNDQNPDGFDPSSMFDDAQIVSPTEGNVDLTVGESAVFVLGDNRPNSQDSRSFGTVSSDDIIGIMGLRFFPLGDFTIF